MQILETLPPEILFCRNYPYYSSFSEYWLDHSRRNALALAKLQRLNSDSLVVEVASNDGYLLRNFVQLGIPVLGIDPASGPAQAARDLGIDTLEDFFGDALARELRDRSIQADLIVANNVLAHVADTLDFVRGLRTLIKPDGLISIEVPYVRDLIDHGEFDTIYHQHLCYFSLTSVITLLESQNLFVNDVFRLPSHGGSLRIYASPNRCPSRNVRSLLEQERAVGLNESDYYSEFSARVRSIRDELVEFLATLKRQGKLIAGYGAAAKACTLLNYCDIGAETVKYIVDGNQHKHGLYMPGVRIPITGPDRLLREQPDYVLLLSWNLAGEILNQQNEYRQRGGKFIIPLPRLHVI